ncbi:SDR family NAD(P)-dependent oxidoreductase [Chryseobacterium gallinarum]|uniref:SDR family NAD(P)-dependent oxidoreductase n=1 Tax=Chryseobacterium gallinarum TaxID=1324352 RepID=UPI002024FE0F|nr:SDR family NAD(P)-dependent oxidoreductase [Chryseobacterium gallinarum]MCL8538383.1 SDR family NAD(P)-dependent oxidoreductase [Chryseobacterium gallinarum]
MKSKSNFVLIIGATEDLSYKIARQLAINGYNLILVAQNIDELEEKSNRLKKLGAEVIAITKNLLRQEEVYSLYSELKLNGISPEILINNTGRELYGKLKNMDVHREIDIVNLNIISTMLLNDLFLKERMQEGSGKILNIIHAAHTSDPGYWIFHGVQCFILSWCHAFKDKLAHTGITLFTHVEEAADTDNTDEESIIHALLKINASKERNSFPDQNTKNSAEYRTVL